MVTELTGIRMVGGSSPTLSTLAPPPAAAALKIGRSGFEPTTAQLDWTALPLDH